MPRRPTTGASQYNVELGDDLLAEWRAFCRSRGGLRYHTEMAFRRHMDNPPPDPPAAAAGPAGPATRPAQGREEEAPRGPPGSVTAH